jgi:hypothetical protein
MNTHQETKNFELSFVKDTMSELYEKIAKILSDIELAQTAKGYLSDLNTKRLEGIIFIYKNRYVIYPQYIYDDIYDLLLFMKKIRCKLVDIPSSPFTYFVYGMLNKSCEIVDDSFRWDGFDNLFSTLYSKYSHSIDTELPKIIYL